MVSKEEAKEKIRELVQTFKDNFKQYKLPTYKEAHVRKDFIDKINHDFGDKL